MSFKLPKTINPETNQPFASTTEYNLYSLKQRINPKTNRPFSSYNEYFKYTLKKRINPETNKYFASIREYKKYLVNRNKEDPKRKKLREIIIKGLEESSKSSYQVAKELRIPRESISQYLNFKSFPHPKRLKKLFKKFNLPYRSIDDLVNS